MAEPSILQDREVEGITVSQPQHISFRNQLASAEQQKLSNAALLLTLIQTAYTNNVRIDQRLFPVRHYKVLGEGATFSVRFNHRSLLPNAPHEVVKISKQTFNADLTKPFNASAARALLLELKILGHAGVRGHPNVTKLSRMTWALYSTEPWTICPALVVEFAHFQTLTHFEESGVELSFFQRKGLALGVAAGLRVLHDNHILHGDVKAENILIFRGEENGEFVAKLSDFGCALMLDECRDSHDRALPQFVRLPAVSPPWHAPEAFDALYPEDVYYTDVFSFGLLTWRILLFQHPATVFDLPLDTTLNKEQFRQIVEFPNLRRLIPPIIEKKLALQDADEFFRLYIFFDIVLNPTPKCRDLSRAMRLLSSEAPWRFWVVTNGQTQMPKEIQIAAEIIEPPVDPASPLKLPSEESKTLTFSSPIILTREILGFPPLSKFSLSILDCRDMNPRVSPLVNYAFHYLTDTFSAIGDSLSSVEFRLFRQMTWALSSHRLLGIGGEANPDGTAKSLRLPVLRTSPADIWKGSCLYLPFCLALDIKISTAERNAVCDLMSSYARASPFVRHRLAAFRRLNGGSRLSQVLDLDAAATESLFDVTTDTKKLEIVDSNKSAPCGDAIEELHLAVHQHNLERLKHSLSSSEIDVNHRDARGDTALLVACRQGNSNLAHCLLTHRADAQIENDVGENGLHWLSSFPETDRAAIATALHDSGARLYPADRSDALKAPEINEDKYITTGFIAGSPFLRAVAFDDEASFEVLWGLLFSDARKYLLEPRFVINLFFQPLKLALMLHVDSIASFLLGHLTRLLPVAVKGVSGKPHELLTFWLDEVGYNFPLWDVLSVNLSMARIMLHGERWKEAQQTSLKLLIEYKICSKWSDMPQARLGALSACILQGNDEALGFLLEQEGFKSCINEPDDILSGSTLIDSALDHHRLAAFKLLVAAGAELDLRRSSHPNHRMSESGSSYLHVCAGNRHETLEYAKIILAHGVPASITNKQGTSTLFLAVLRGNFSLARLLLQHGGDINVPEVLGYRILGMLLDPGFDWQCDDQVESLKFLLSLEAEGKGPLFNVSANDDTSALMKAAYYPNAGPQLAEIMTVLLKHFSRPEQINARSTRKSRTAAIQAAIAASNVAAVRALVKAGADLDIKDHSGATLLDLAVSQFYINVQGANPQRQASKGDRLQQCLEIISIIAEAAHWPEQIERGMALKQLLTSTKGLIGRMMHVPHFLSEQEGLHKVLATIVAETMHATLEHMDLSALVDTRRQLELILGPVFHVELRLIVERVDTIQNLGTDAEPTTNEEIKEEALRRLPVLKDLNLAMFNRLKQASLFECILEAERRASFNAQSPFGGTGFWKFARSGKREDLPYDHRYVTYPETLLECWTSLIKEDSLNLKNRANRDFVVRTFRLLQIRSKQQAEGQFPLSEFNAEFRKFHFRNLLALDHEVQAVELLACPGLVWGCRCMRNEIGTIPLHLVRKLNDNIGHEMKQQGVTNTYENLLEYYDRKVEEVQRKKAQSVWKREVLESEPKVETSSNYRVLVENTFKKLIKALKWGWLHKAEHLASRNTSEGLKDCEEKIL